MVTAKPAGVCLLRRSQRVPLSVSLLVSSLDSKHKFSENGETTSISKHGCLLRVPVSLDPGTRVRLDLPDQDHPATARVVRAEPCESESRMFAVALEMDEAKNVWGLEAPPEDWIRSELAETPARAAPEGRELIPSKTTGRVPFIGHLDDLARRVELLRERARALAAEFEDLSRVGIADKLSRWRADFEGWERLRSQAQKGLEEAARQARRVVEQALERFRQESADVESQFESNLQEFGALQKQIEARAATVEDRLRDQAALERDQLLVHAQEGLQSFIRDLRQEANAQLGRLQELAEETGRDLRRKLCEDVNHQQRDFLRRVEAQYGEARSAENELRQYVEEVSAGVARQTDELLGKLQVELAQRQEEFARKLDQKGQELADCVERAGEELARSAAAMREEQTVSLQGELERGLAVLAGRAEAAASVLGSLVESVQGERARLAAEVTELKELAARTQGWYRNETEKFQKLAEDALSKAACQMDEQIKVIVEKAPPPTIDASAIDAMLHARSAELLAQFEQQAETLAQATATRFQEQAECLANNTAMRLQATLHMANETLEHLTEATESIFRALRQYGLD